MTASFSSVSATGNDMDEVLEDLCLRAVEALPGEGPPDLAFLFVTPDYGAAVSEAGAAVRDAVEARHLMGCTGGGVIGAEAEREGGHSAALLLARLPGSKIRPFHVTQQDLAAMGSLEDLEGLIGVPADEDPTFLLLPEPFSLDADGLLGALNHVYAGRPVLGGLASGGARPGLHVLFLDGERYPEGAVGLALTGGEVRVTPLVSQGCRPVGRRFAVTKGEGNRIHTLAGKTAEEALRETVASLSEEDQSLARTSLHLGRVAHEASADFHRGDFLIRNLVALVPEDGSLLVGDHVRVGQTVQFQLRDAATAAEDLGEMLDVAIADGEPAAALLFSCGGRGSHLFGRPDHDLGMIRRRLGEFPLAGFFCNGEIGPVGRDNFLHGFTTSLALFR